MKITILLLKWLVCGLHFFFAIPIMGNLLITAMFWTPLVLLFGLHVITLVLCKKQGFAKGGHIVGIICSLLGWIPFVGWTIHLATGITMLVETILSMINKKEVSTHV